MLGGGRCEAGGKGVGGGGGVVTLEWLGGCPNGGGGGEEGEEKGPIRKLTSEGCEGDCGVSNHSKATAVAIAARRDSFELTTALQVGISKGS